MILLLAVSLLVQDKTADQLIEQLRSSQPTERESATQELAKMGEGARRALEKGAKDQDAEVARRAQQLLADLDSVVAREAFGKLRKSLVDAKTASIKFHQVTTVDGSDTPAGVLDGEILMKGPERFRIDIKGTAASVPRDMMFVASGNRIYFRRLADSWKETRIETWGRNRDGLWATLSLCLVSFNGLAASTSFYEPDQDLLKARRNIRDKISDLNFGDREDHAPILTYHFQVSSDLCRVALTFDPKTNKLVKRIEHWEVAGKKPTTLIETFPEWNLTADIPDDKFNLPEEKK